jgi:hypothetical protein
LCPSRTRTLDDEGFRKRAYHGEKRGYQTVNHDYNIDPENEYKFDHEYGDNV